MTAVDQVITPRLGERLRRWRFWIGVGGLVVVFAVVSLAVAGTGVDGVRLSPTNPAPTGAKALAEVLRARGIDVRVSDTAQTALDDGSLAGATVLLHDPDAILDEQRLRRIGEAGASRIVLLEPSTTALATLAPGVHPVGTADGAVDAACTDPVAARAERISGASELYAGDDALWCFTEGAGARMLVAGDVVVVGASAAFMNESIAADGNAALALGLLGGTDVLVWLQPDVDDALADGAPTLASLSPAWVVPLTLLGVAVVVAAGVWRGRRFGPLVIEPLPAVVPADETMRGRARLRQASGARLRTADSLRIGAVRRLAGVLRVPARVDAVTSAVAAATGRDAAWVRDVLVGRVPGSDAELVRLVDDLDELERAVRGGG